MIGFIVRRWFPFKRDDKEKEEKFWKDHSGKAMLTSLVNDVDLATDWVYFHEIFNRNNDNIGDWIRYVLLASCIAGTTSWLFMASDGRVLHWFRHFGWLIVAILHVISFLIEFALDGECFGKENSYLYNILEKVVSFVETLCAHVEQCTLNNTLKVDLAFHGVLFFFLELSWKTSPRSF